MQNVTEDLVRVLPEQWGWRPESSRALREVKLMAIIAYPAYARVFQFHKKAAVLELWVAVQVHAILHNASGDASPLQQLHNGER
jgi:hypothetical protein